mgnify:CR=1 FL=1
MLINSWNLGFGALDEAHTRPQWSLVLCATLALAVWGGSVMQLSLDNLMLLWPAGAVAIAGLWLLGWRWGLPAVVLGTLVGSLFLSLEPAQLAARTVAVTVTGGFGSLLMHRLRVSPELSVLRDMLLFLSCVVVFAPIVGNLSGWAVHQLFEVSNPGPDAIWWHCAVAEIIACMLFLPIVFGSSDSESADSRWGLAYVVAVLFAAAIVYFDLLPSHLAMTLPLAYLAFPLMLSAAFHLSQRAIAGLLLLNGLMALWGTSHGMGPFTLASSSESIASLQGHLVLLSVTSLLLCVALAERRRSMRLHQQSEERYRLIVEHQSEALVKTDADGLAIYATPSAKEWLDHSEKEDNFLLWLSEHCDGCSYTNMRAGLMSGDRVTQDQFLEDTVLRWTLTPVRSSSGALEAVIAVGHDVTVECAAEQRAHRHLEELSHLGRLGDMAQMAGGLAHELNQPLTAVMTFAQAAERLLPADAETTNTRQALARVVGNTQRAADIVRQARNFMGNKNAEHRPQDMAQVVRDAMSLIDFETRRHGVKLAMAPVTRVPWARVSSVQVHQILVNLIRNAMQAMAGQKTEKRITLHLDRDADRMWLDVVDTGPGMASSVSEQAFEPFSGTRGDGLGLGLSICRAIAESHGGSIGLEPVEKGTCVRLILPLDMPDSGNDDDEVAELLATIA